MEPLARGLREAVLILMAAVSVYSLVTLATYDANDPGWSHTGAGTPVENWGGVAGAWLADVLLSLFGYVAYLFPILIAYGGWLMFRGRSLKGQGLSAEHVLRTVGFIVLIATGSGLAALHFRTDLIALPAGAGGIAGDMIGDFLVGVFSPIGASLLLAGLFLGAMTLSTTLSWLSVLDHLGEVGVNAARWITRRIQDGFERLSERREQKQHRHEQQLRKQKVAKTSKPRIEPTVKAIEPSERAQKERQVTLFDGLAGDGMPPLALLDEANGVSNRLSDESLEAISRLVELKLRDFGVEVEVVAVHPGPVITRFELQPAAGVKVSQINNLSKDLARSLSAVSVRVVDVIPGKTVVGLEVPNENRELVYLSEILKSREYDQASSPLTLALGKDISGQPMVADLAKMPHLLVAGTTGSGKSVAINAMLLSLLYKAEPEDARLILIDPKMLELSVYEGIAHLLTPVVTDMKDAANVLRWCVAEMERRYHLMAQIGVRNLSGFNRKVEEAQARGEPITDPFYDPEMAFDPEQAPPTLTRLPNIVVVVDELADLMMVVGKKVEELIARLAQKARAAGIHLILATQRPSVDVITGLIKANIPTRVAFQVSSRVDSRTILDQMGAEQLLGHGDMLYLKPGTGIPVRVHGAFVADHEVHNVVNYLRKQGEPDYDGTVLEGASDGSLLPGNGGAEGSDPEADELYDEAVRIVTESRKASISGVQRRLRIGYNRAARLIEAMESAGVVGEMQSNGSREVLAPRPIRDD